MHSALEITLLNTVFWTALHFGTAELVTHLPLDVQHRLFDWQRPFFHVSEKEMTLYRRLRLPRWKDRLPQFNPEFDKRHLAASLTPAYLREFLGVTCHAEIIHELIALLGFFSLFFCLLCERPLDWLPLFFLIALFIGLCNLPFAAIQRYNRYRLLRLLRRSCLLVASSFTISSRNSTSDSYNTFVFVVADIPICLLPASTPNDTGCTFLSDSYCSCMVNGHFFTTFAIPDFNIRQTFPCRSVGINGCPSFATTYTMIQVPFFWCVTAVSRTHLP